MECIADVFFVKREIFPNRDLACSCQSAEIQDPRSVSGKCAEAGTDLTRWISATPIYATQACHTSTLTHPTLALLTSPSDIWRCYIQDRVIIAEISIAHCPICHVTLYCWGDLINCHKCIFSQLSIVTSFRLSHSAMYCNKSLGTDSGKNYGIIWEFFPNGGPPPPPPPFGNPLFKKKFYRLFCILDP